MTRDSSTENASMAERFRALHAEGTFLLPNPWDVGSARILQGLGFKAIATTSGGFANSLGRLDQNVTATEVFRHVSAMTAAVTIPLSVDFENGYATTPEGIARNIDTLADCGAAGASIEDYDPVSRSAYPIEEAIERVMAAVEASRASGMVITARSENHLYSLGSLNDTIERLCAFRDAGADCLYAPGLSDRNDIARVVEEVGAPINVLARPAGPSVQELRELGVRRISVGSALARHSYFALEQAAEELMDAGTYGFATDRLDAQLAHLAFELPAPEVGFGADVDLTDGAVAGSCACGAVRFRVAGAKLRPVWYCYCEDCRRVTGNAMAASGAPDAEILFDSDSTLRWWSRQPGVEYGFCSQCGSTLFWRAADKPNRTSIAAGSLDGVQDLEVAGVLFHESKPSWAGDAPADAVHHPGDLPA